MRAVQDLRPRLVRAAERPELGVGLDDEHLQAGLLQVGRGRQAAGQPAADDDHIEIKSSHKTRLASSAMMSKITVAAAIAVISAWS